jgi:hypothetical protein
MNLSLEASLDLFDSRLVLSLNFLEDLFVNGDLMIERVINTLFLLFNGFDFIFQGINKGFKFSEAISLALVLFHGRHFAVDNIINQFTGCVG